MEGWGEETGGVAELRTFQKVMTVSGVVLIIEPCRRYDSIGLHSQKRIWFREVW